MQYVLFIQMLFVDLYSDNNNEVIILNSLTMTHFQTISGLTAKNIKLIALEVIDLEVSVYDAKFDTYLSVRVQNLLLSTKLDISYVARKCYFLMYDKKVN